MAPNATNSYHGRDQCPAENGSENRKDNERGVSGPPTRPELQQRLKRTQSDGAALISSEFSRLSLNNPEAEQVIVQCQCECCGLSEECTAGYIGRVRELFCGRWICGLCAEAAKEERNRMESGTPIEAALQAHISFCKKFNNYERANPAVNVADAMRKLLKKSRSKPNGPPIPKGNLGRSTSCIPSITRDLSE